MARGFEAKSFGHLVTNEVEVSADKKDVLLVKQIKIIEKRPVFTHLHGDGHGVSTLCHVEIKRDEIVGKNGADNLCIGEIVLVHVVWRQPYKLTAPQEETVAVDGDLALSLLAIQKFTVLMYVLLYKKAVVITASEIKAAVEVFQLIFHAFHLTFWIYCSLYWLVCQYGMGYN